MTTKLDGRRAADTLGIVDLPMPVAEMTARRWDVIVVGAGHNGLACAAYLAQAGKRVLVLEARASIGGACTLEEPWPGSRISPCAYVAGLLHPLVIDQLNFAAYGCTWFPSPEGMFVPFNDGSSVQLWDDEERCAAEIARLSPPDVVGWHAMHAVIERARDALRPSGASDLWIGPPPTQEMVADRLRGDPEALGLVFEWSMVDYVERYLEDERLQMAVLGQGVIGANASPYAAGTASIHFHHSSGRQGGMAGMWGYVQGGMGMVSFILYDIARDAGVVVAAGMPVARILPGDGVELAGGEQIHAPVVVSNADPRVTLRLLGDAADAGWRAQVETMPIQGRIVKVNAALHELPNFTARPGALGPQHFGQVNTPLPKREWSDYHALAEAGQLPPCMWCELYFQSPHDASVAPMGKHTMSVLAQYAPYHFANGSWATRRQEVGERVIQSIARYCSNLPEALIALDVLGPPDIEQKTGLTGGQIFQGECLPAYMWDKRLAYRTPMPGLYLCGACTYPGGSVIAINGRNAAMQIINDHPSP
jgi:phytoene dehydrogenase-like protein